MPCDRCKELEAEVHRLKVALGLEDPHPQARRMADAFGVHLGVGAIIDRLYRSGGRTLTKADIEDARPNPRRVELCHGKTAHVYICDARKAIGYDGIKTIRHYGYRITPEGMRAVEEALRKAEERAAA